MRLYQRTMLLMLFSSTGWAGMDTEIAHLLQYVETMSCTYERNGTMHDGQEAVEHIRKKYEYYEEDIKTTEDFIQYSATKSMMSGKYYLIHCPGAPAVKSQQWLLDELARYREGSDSEQ